MKNQQLLIAILFAVLSLLINLVVTRHYHVGVSPDSITYIQGARTFSAGYEPVDTDGKLITGAPPLYPISLAVFCKLIGTDILNGADYFSALLIALSIFIASLICIRLGFSISAIILINLFLLLSPAFIDVFRMLWSETLFIFLLLTAVYCLYKWMDTDSVWLIILSGILSGMGLLTRYAGIGLVGGIFLYLLFGSKKSVKSRIITSVIYGLFTALVFGGWVFLVLKNPSGSMYQGLVIHPVSKEHLIALIGTIAKWLSPSFLPGMILVACTILYLLVRILPKKTGLLDSYRRREYQLLIYMIATYFIFLACSISFVFFSTPFDNRMLSPIYPLCVILAVPFADQVKRINPRLGYGLVATILLIYAGSFYFKTRDFLKEGREFTGKVWTTSSVLSSLRVPDSTEVYSNGEDVLKFWKPGNVRYQPLPLREDPNTKLFIDNFSVEMNKLKDSVRSGKAILVNFDNITYRFYYAQKDELIRFFSGCCRINHYTDGIVISAARQNAQDSSGTMKN